MSREGGEAGGQVQGLWGKAAAKRRRAWRAWVALMDRREPPTQLALVRIGLGLVACLELVHVRLAGLVDPLFSRWPDGYATGYAPWFGISGPMYWWIATIAAAAIALGAATRVACIVFLIASAQLGHLAPESETAVDMIFRIVSVILAMSQCNARWSIDALVTRSEPLVPAWPRILIMLQVVWVYFSGGQNKGGSEWGPLGGFTALADAVADPHAARFAADWVTTVYPLTRVATAVTMLFELGAPLYLLFVYYAATRDRAGRLRRWCNRLRLRWAWLALGIVFEVSLAVLLRLGSFPFGMLALFPALLLPEDLQRLNTAAPANRASSPS